MKQYQIIKIGSLDLTNEFLMKASTIKSFEAINTTMAGNYWTYTTLFSFDSKDKIKIMKIVKTIPGY